MPNTSVIKTFEATLTFRASATFKAKPMIRDLGHVIDREKSDIGVFITLDKATRPMIEEAALKGFYHSPNGRDYPRIQILTIEEIFQGKTADTPSWLAPIPKPPPVKRVKGKTARML